MFNFAVCNGMHGEGIIVNVFVYLCVYTRLYLYISFYNVCPAINLHHCIASCSGQGVRLVNGSDVNGGRVEVCRNGVWGTVYGTSGGWNSAAGQIVCRQLGFQNPGQV